MVDRSALTYAKKASHERKFYSEKKAFGRFGMRLFKPKTMPVPHWHGHIEMNILRNAAMTYIYDDEEIEVLPDQLVIFWAGIPHQLTEVRPTGNAQPILSNLYMPLDAFLFLPHIPRLQVALLGGGLATIPASSIASDQMERWYADYRSADYERTELIKMELNAILRRSLSDGIEFLRTPVFEADADRGVSSAHIHHVVAMVRFILENLSEPITNADVSSVTGLHQNYALSLFTNTMHVSMKRFIIRMRLLRARAMLMESSLAISNVAEKAGFSSTSQFYEHFKNAYGMPPNALRKQYATAALI